MFRITLRTPRLLTRSALLMGVGLLTAGAAQATCSGEPMLGSICVVTYNFCPRGFADAAGQLLPIQQHTALFSLMGTTFGGNGQTTFALPDLRGRTPVGVGQGPGLSSVTEGEMFGQEAVTLNVAQLPPHSHGATLKGGAAAGTSDSPANNAPARLARSNIYGAATDTNMAAGAISVATTGGGQPIAVRNPSLGLRYCIALEGFYPSRN